MTKANYLYFRISFPCTQLWLSTLFAIFITYTTYYSLLATLIDTDTDFDYLTANQSFFSCLNIRINSTVHVQCTVTRCEYDHTDMPKMKLLNKKSVGGICIHLFYHNWLWWIRAIVSLQSMNNLCDIYDMMPNGKAKERTIFGRNTDWRLKVLPLKLYYRAPKTQTPHIVASIP